MSCEVMTVLLLWVLDDNRITKQNMAATCCSKDNPTKFRVTLKWASSMR